MAKLNLENLNAIARSYFKSLPAIPYKSDRKMRSPVDCRNHDRIYLIFSHCNMSLVVRRYGYYCDDDPILWGRTD